MKQPGINEGDVIHTVQDPKGQWFWYVQKPGYEPDASLALAVRDDLLNGPFATEQELKAAVFGPNCQFKIRA